MKRTGWFSYLMVNCHMKWILVALISFLPFKANADNLGEMFTESRFKDYPKVESPPPADYDFYVYHVDPSQRERFTSVKVNKSTGRIFELAFSGYKTVHEAVAQASRLCEGEVELPMTAANGSFPLKCVPGGRQAGRVFKFSIDVNDAHYSLTASSPEHRAVVSKPGSNGAPSSPR